MLRRLMPREESMALVAGGRMPRAPRRMRAELKLSTGFSPYKTDSVLAMLAGSTPGA